MEVELEPRVKPLSFKIKGMSRESPSQKASHLLDPDLRNHWSTATNTKEWILLELDDPCLLSHIRIYNKSVLEWEIAVGLRYKPETFVKVRPRCEAPRRDMMYPMNYTPCRYVRISCLRGNPIAIFFIQLIGVSVTGLEPEFQPVVNHLLPQIISHKQDAHDLHLQLLQDMTNRLVAFLPQLEADLSSFSDDPDLNLRFLAMLAGPFYPILHIVNERETARLAGNTLDSEAPKNSQPSSALTVSSNFEPRRSRSTSTSSLPTASSIVFRADTIFMLLRKAYRDSHLGTFSRMASRILLKFIEPLKLQQGSVPSSDETCSPDEASKSELSNPPPLVDYSNLFGDEFRIPDDFWDTIYLSVLDVAAVEEGIFHVLCASASQPLLCSKLADSMSDFWSALPLVQALLPALRPNFIGSDHVDDSFSQWKQPSVQHALSQIVATSSLPVFRPLLHVCAGFLSSVSPSHAKAACVLIDLCSGVLAPWMAQVIAKVDLTLELLEDLLGVIQVLANLTSVQSYFDFFSNKIDQKVTELEEAEMELDLLQKEQVVQESSHDSKELCQLPFVATCAKDDDRLQKIKDSIRSLEKSKLKEEIIARRQKKLLVRRARQKYLEEAALREAELLQELDSERTTEVEREIERQRLLELERAKTRELRHQLDMEKEKQSQRDLQRELEQVESGLRPARREFSTSTHSGRPRERYRERENGRSSTEGNLRTSSGSLQTETGTSNSSLTTMPSVVLAGSRPFSGQVPTILQSRDRLDDGGSSYEENFDGSKDSGDTGSIGDADLVSALEGQPGGVGSAQRHGSRGSKSSRQMIERRERDGRREGKWERKHY